MSKPRFRLFPRTPKNRDLRKKSPHLFHAYAEFPESCPNCRGEHQDQLVEYDSDELEHDLGEEVD